MRLFLRRIAAVDYNWRMVTPMRNWLLLVLIALTHLAVADTVYVTREDGVTSFSDTPPAEGEALETITVQAPPASDPEQFEERLAQMRESTDRMAAERRAREKHRAELRAAAREERQEPTQQPTPGPVVVAGGGYWPGYGVSPRPWHPGRPQRPRRWLSQRPPPGWSVMQPRNEQLMRPIVSGRRGER